MGVVGTGEQDVNGITEAQREAVEEAMKLILEEDRERGVTLEMMFDCEGCARSRPLAGAVTYFETTLCNDCATRFELERVAGTVRNSAEYVERRRRGRRKMKKVS